MAIPICEKCGKQDETVYCYEGYGVIARLCPAHDGPYLAKMKSLNDAVLKDVNGSPIMTYDNRQVLAQNIKNWKKDNI